MPYHFDVKTKRSGLNPDNLKYYALPVRSGVLTTRQLSKVISGRCTLSETDVIATLSALSGVLEEYLMQGYHVKMDGIGRFSLSISSPGMDTPEKVTATHVKAKRICFMADKNLKEELVHVEFRKKAKKK